MGKISQEKKIKDYYKIYEQIYVDPTISLIELSKKTKMSRNTISKYLHEMHFSDPFFTFKGLRDFPHVVYHAMTSGSWNTLVVTDRHLDFSKLVGFQSLLYQGVKVRTSTPKVEYNPWDESVVHIGQVAQCTPEQLEPKDRSPPC